MVVPYHLLSNDVIDWMKQYMPPTFYVHIDVNDVIDWMERYIPSILYVHIGVNDVIDWMKQYILPTLYVHIDVIVDSTKVPVLKNITYFFFFFVCPWPDPSFSYKKMDDARTHFASMLCMFWRYNEY